MDQKTKKKSFFDKHPLLERIVITLLFVAVLFAIAFPIYWFNRDNVHYSSTTWALYTILAIAGVIFIFKATDNPKEKKDTVFQVP